MLLGAVATTLARRGSSQSVLVPIRLQAELIAKVVVYDRNFAARAGERTKVLILSKASDNESTLVATEMKSALSAVALIADLPHDEELFTYTDPQSLSELCKARGYAIIYLGPGFTPQIEGIREAMSNFDLLTVGGVAEYVPAGIVLGFDLVSGKPKLLVHLTQARKQHVDFRAEALKLMRIYE